MSTPVNFDDTIHIVLDSIPPSLNSYYRHGGRRTYITKVGKAFARKVANKVVHPHGYCFVGPVTVNITFTVPDKRAHDLDNFFKALLDNLEGWTFTNDQYITQLNSRKVYKKNVSKTEVEIRTHPGGYELFTKNLR